MPKFSCPREGAALENRRSRGVSFLECSECHGLLFELTELELALERFPTPGGLRHWIESVLPVRAVDSKLRCVCEGSPVMTAVERAGVEVDVCPRCGSLWLDRGELEKIREREKKEHPTNALDPLDHDWHRHHYRRDHHDHNHDDVEDDLEVDDSGDEADGLLDGLAEWLKGLIEDGDFDFD